MIKLNFNNNEVKYFDMKSYLNHGIFRELQDLRIFNSVKKFFRNNK